MSSTKDTSVSDTFSVEVKPESLNIRLRNLFYVEQSQAQVCITIDEGREFAAALDRHDVVVAHNCGSHQRCDVAFCHEARIQAAREQHRELIEDWRVTPAALSREHLDELIDDLRSYDRSHLSMQSRGGATRFAYIAAIIAALSAERVVNTALAVATRLERAIEHWNDPDNTPCLSNDDDDRCAGGMSTSAACTDELSAICREAVALLRSPALAEERRS